MRKHGNAVLEAWLDHPLVRHAQAHLPAETSTLDLLTETLRLMNELEGRFPGIPFEEILSAPMASEADLEAMRGEMSAAGVSPIDVYTVAGGPKPMPPRPYQRKFTEQELVVLRDAYESRDCEILDFCAKHEISKATLYRLRSNGWSYTP